MYSIPRTNVKRSQVDYQSRSLFLITHAIMSWRKYTYFLYYARTNSSSCMEFIDGLVQIVCLNPNANSCSH